MRVWTAAPGLFRQSEGLLFVDTLIFFNTYTDATSTWKLMAHNVISSATASIYETPGEASYLTMYNRKLYFSIRDSLMEHDPVTKVTTLIAYYSTPSVGDNIWYVASANNNIYFATENDIYEYTGSGLPKRIESYWYDYNQGPQTTMWCIAGYKGNVYFPCKDGNNRCRLCEYNPSTKAIKKFSNGDNPSNLALCKGKLYFSARDTNVGNISNYELWSYDGSGIPKMEVDINPGRTMGSSPIFMTNYNDVLFFTGQLWRTNAAGTENIGAWEVLKYDPSKPLPSGISSVFFNGDVAIYPNPATDAAYIKMQLKEKQDIAVQLCNAMGQVVYTIPQATYTAGNTQLQLPMTNIPAGIYHVQLINDNGRLLHTAKLVKQ